MVCSNDRRDRVVINRYNNCRFLCLNLKAPTLYCTLPASLRCSQRWLWFLRLSMYDVYSSSLLWSLSPLSFQSYKKKHWYGRCYCRRRRRSCKPALQKSVVDLEMSVNQGVNPQCCSWEKKNVERWLNERICSINEWMDAGVAGAKMLEGDQEKRMYGLSLRGSKLSSTIAMEVRKQEEGKRRVAVW